jgi:hypothetical protein
LVNGRIQGVDTFMAAVPNVVVSDVVLVILMLVLMLEYKRR